MATINIKKLGLSFGLTFAILYLGCVFVMSTVSRETAVFFFNSLLHGIDVDSVLRTSMPLYEMVIGIVEIFILGWLIGASIASIYNLSFKKRRQLV